VNRIVGKGTLKDWVLHINWLGVFKKRGGVIWGKRGGKKGKGTELIKHDKIKSQGPGVKNPLGGPDKSPKERTKSRTLKVYETVISSIHIVTKWTKLS